MPRRICDQGTGSGPSFVHSATMSNAEESAEYVHPWLYLSEIFAYRTKGHATRSDIVDDIVDVSPLTMAFNVAKIASSARSLTISLTKSLRVAGP